MVDILRTPDERFRSLKDYPFEPRYAEIDGLRMHYVDEGPREAEPILMLHGEPSWSYLYRSMIPICAQRYRVIAPDLVGFGKSDKPADVSAYTYAAHVEWTTRLVLGHLGLERITLFGQDWGSLIGLRMAAENEERFSRIVIGNGFLPTGDRKLPLVFHVWRLFARWTPILPISRIVSVGTGRRLDSEERRAYDAPFPSSRYKAGARAFPAIVPRSPDDPAAAANRAAWEVLDRWRKPFLTIFGSGDPIMRGADRVFQKRVPGAEGQPHRVVRGGHFLQEDAGPELAEAIVELVFAT